MRIITTALWAALGCAALACAMPADVARAQGASQLEQDAYGVGSASPRVAPSRRGRPRVRIYRQYDERGVYPSYYPGPDAVRDCTANLVQEFRPSGTVIVPRMNCYWRRG